MARLGWGGLGSAIAGCCFGLLSGNGLAVRVGVIGLCPSTMDGLCD
jgi:hypothetical protein